MGSCPEKLSSSLCSGLTSGLVPMYLGEIAPTHLWAALPPRKCSSVKGKIDFTIFANSFKQSWLVMKTRKKNELYTY